jgi:hypothetical protein
MKGLRRAALLAALAGLLLAAGASLGYVRAELVGERAFSERLVSSLDDRAVRAVVARRTVDALVDGSASDLLAVRPLALAAVEGLVGSPSFRRLAVSSARLTHRALVTGDTSLVVDLAGTGLLLHEALASVSPAVAARAPAGVRPRLAELDPGAVDLGAVRDLIELSRWWWALLAASVCAGALALVLSPEPRRSLGHLGAAVAAAGALIVAAIELGEALLPAPGGEEERAAIEAVWQALFGDLRSAALVLAAAGLLVAAIVANLVDPGRAAERLAGWRRRARIPRPLRGLALIAAGAACVLAPADALNAIVVLAGAALIYLGGSELAALLPGRPRLRGERASGGLVAGCVLVTAIAAGTAALLIALDAPELPEPAPAQPRAGCNGSTALCARRLNEVVFAGTHNSYAASDEPGWLFPNQRRSIARQLDDGIRALLIDVHWGVRDRDGRVRTDLRAEGSDRNKVARELNPEALRIADRLAGRVGARLPGGRPRPFLCHTLCELGSEPLDQELDVIRRFLESHPADVLVVIVEPYVPPVEIERALERTGLLRYAAALHRDAPLPTLGELVADGTRLVLFAEKDGGARPWYMPAFSFTQDTPLGAVTPAQLSCKRFRGDADSPLLLLNHWIDRFPPRPSDNEPILREPFLKKRIERCSRVRAVTPGIVAVDFYERGALVEVVRTLNLP